MAEEKKPSILKMMADSISDRKTAAAAGLTPVAGEVGRPRIPEVPSVFLTNEAVADIAKDLRRQAAVLLDVADGLDKHTAVSTVPAIVIDEAEIKRQAEKEADERVRQTTPETEAIKARIAASQAQAVYTPEQSAAILTAAAEAAAAGGDVQTVMAAAMSAVGWVCPVHGTAMDKVSPKKRAYRGCPEADCREFELPS